MTISISNKHLRACPIIFIVAILSACGSGADSPSNASSASQSTSSSTAFEETGKAAAAVPGFAINPPPPPEILPAPWTVLTTTDWLEHEVNDDLKVLQSVPQVMDDGPAHFKREGDIDMFNLASSSTNRVEIRTLPNYSSGHRAFDGWFLAESPTNGETIMQIFGSAANNATTAMFRVSDSNSGSLEYYDGQVLATEIYGKWTRLTITHDAAENGIVTASVNGKQVGSWDDHGTATHWMKYGAYGSHDDAHPATVYWANVKLYQH